MKDNIFYRDEFLRKINNDERIKSIAKVGVSELKLLWKYGIIGNRTPYENCLGRTKYKFADVSFDGARETSAISFLLEMSNKDRS